MMVWWGKDGEYGFKHVAATRKGTSQMGNGQKSVASTDYLGGGGFPHGFTFCTATSKSFSVSTSKVSFGRL
jgi:hypothetical protein